MDSLSRILSFNAQKSACTSVAIQGGTLYISANVSGDGTQDEMARIFYSRATKLQNFIITTLQQTQASNHSFNLSNFLEKHSQKLANEIMTEASVSVNKSRLASDISKFVHSMTIDKVSFDDRTKNLWLTEPFKVTVLLPQKGEKEVVSLSIYENAPVLTSSHVLPKPKHFPVVSNYHAEQMLVH